MKNFINHLSTPISTSSDGNVYAYQVYIIAIALIVVIATVVKIHKNKTSNS